MVSLQDVRETIDRELAIGMFSPERRMIGGRVQELHCWKDRISYVEFRIYQDGLEPAQF